MDPMMTSPAPCEMETGGHRGAPHASGGSCVAGLLPHALERLRGAVAMLEAAGAAALGESDECVKRIDADLAAARSDCQALQLANRRACGRIDAAIGRLRAVLEA